MLRTLRSNMVIRPKRRNNSDISLTYEVSCLQSKNNQELKVVTSLIREDIWSKIHKIMTNKNKYKKKIINMSKKGYNGFMLWETTSFGINKSFLKKFFSNCDTYDELVDIILDYLEETETVQNLRDTLELDTIQLGIYKKFHPITMIDTVEVFFEW